MKAANNTSTTQDAADAQAPTPPPDCQAGSPPQLVLAVRPACRCFRCESAAAGIYCDRCRAAIQARAGADHEDNDEARCIHCGEWFDTDDMIPCADGSAENHPTGEYVCDACFQP